MFVSIHVFHILYSLEFEIHVYLKYDNSLSRKSKISL